MSDAETLLNANDIEARAAHFLRKSALGDWSEDDQAALDEWLAQSMVHSVTYWRLKAAWARTERMTALVPASPAAEPSRRAWPVFLGFAASIAAAAIISVGVYSYKSSVAPGIQTYSTDVGGRETVSFSDGTRIEMNTDTAVRARMTTKERTVWLDKGEAYFQVRHDPARPLTVYVAGHRVVDLGTEFLVRDDANYLEVALLKGRARVADDAAQKASAPVTLSPGDVALATGHDMSVTKMNAHDLETQLGWRRGVLVFYHTTLADAVDEINRYNRQKLVIADPDVAKLRINGTFPANNAALFGRVAQVVLKLHVENKGDEISISH